MSNTGISIRRAAVADAPDIIASINAVCAEEIYLETDHFISNVCWEAVLYRPESVPDHLILIAQVTHALVGMANLFPGRYGSKDKHIAELGIHVIAEYRDQGIGTSLLRQAIDWASQQGIEKIVLSVFSTNACAVHVYDKFGFECEGIRRRQFRVRGEYVDEMLMARFL